MAKSDGIVGIWSTDSEASESKAVGSGILFILCDS